MRSRPNKMFNFFIWISLISFSTSAKTPHIIMIVADDLGWNDVGFHGSVQIPTPNIDALAYSGVILNNYYTQPICTPSRSALLSGMHPIHTGLQHRTIGGPSPYGLPLDLTLLPQYLKSLGYTSKHVGKWHLGCFKRDYTPTYRGFDTHFGYWTGRVDYYDHTAYEQPGWWGYDFRRNMKVDREAYGKYTTDLLTEESIRIIDSHNASEPLFLYLAHLAVHSGNPYNPLQAPADVVERFSYIQDEKRRKFAGMLWKLDESVGMVIEALESNQMLEDSILVFTTDNGGPAAGFNANAASNWPFRGVKASVWEGGMRGAACVWSPLLSKPGTVSTEMMQIVDWLPTLYSAAGGNLSELPTMDGMDMWESIVNGTPSKRVQMLHNIDPILNQAAVRVGEWKLLFNPSPFGPHWDKWFGPSGRNLNETYSSQSLKKWKSIKKSRVGKAMQKIRPGLYENASKLENSAEILCGPVPSNATAHCSNPSAPCLFHIPSDPCEYHDVSKDNPARVKVLQNILANFNKTAVPPANQPRDPAANPIYWSYTWTNWQDFKIGPSFRKDQANHFYDIEYVADHLWL